MPVHNVIQGETIISIAGRYGFNWETLWNHGDNAELKQKRQDPGILLPGDVVVIPEIAPKTVSAEMCNRHRFRLSKQLAIFRVKVEDSAGKPCPGKKFLLEIGTLKIEGVTDGGALIELKIPAQAQQGKLTVWLEDEHQTILNWNLKLGHLNPINSISGIQARLSNLGFPVGEINGQIGPQTTSAILTFQIVHGLTASGVVDNQLMQKLKELHDRSGA